MTLESLAELHIKAILMAHSSTADDSNFQKKWLYLENLSGHS